MCGLTWRVSLSACPTHPQWRDAGEAINQHDRPDGASRQVLAFCGGLLPFSFPVLSSRTIPPRDVHFIDIGATRREREAATIETPHSGCPTADSSPLSSLVNPPSHAPQSQGPPRLLSFSIDTHRPPARPTPHEPTRFRPVPHPLVQEKKTHKITQDARGATRQVDEIHRTRGTERGHCRQLRRRRARRNALSSCHTSRRTCISLNRRWRGLVVTLYCARKLRMHVTSSQGTAAAAAAASNTHFILAKRWPVLPVSMAFWNSSRDCMYAGVGVGNRDWIG